VLQRQTPFNGCDSIVIVRFAELLPATAESFPAERKDRSIQSRVAIVRKALHLLDPTTVNRFPACLVAVLMLSVGGTLSAQSTLPSLPRVDADHVLSALESATLQTERINDRVYQRPARPPHLAFGPTIGRSGAAAAVAIRW
jgi:hypothetical protein